MSSDNSQSESGSLTKALGRVLAEGTIAVLATLMELPANYDGPSRVGAKLLVKGSEDRVSGFGDLELDEATTKQAGDFLRSRVEAKTLRAQEFAPHLERFHDALVLFERIEGEPRLVICGAGHVGASLARLAALVGYRVTLIDDRAEFVDRKLFSLAEGQRIELVLAAEWAAATCSAVANGRGVSVAIVTRGHKQDEDCLRALSSAAPDYVGMIGSKRRTSIVLDKLREEGFDESFLGKVRAPIGLDIGAVSPEEVALAILAEIVAERRGGEGSSLSDWRRRTVDAI